MAYGVSILDANGKSLLNDGEKVPSFYAKFAISTSTTAVATGTINTGLKSNRNCIVVSNLASKFGVSIVNGEYTITWRALAKTTKVVTGYLYVFTNYPNAAGSYGVQVFNSDGSIAYQNTGKSIRILDMVTVNSGPRSYPGKVIASLTRDYKLVEGGNGTFTDVIAYGPSNGVSGGSMGNMMSARIPSVGNILMTAYVGSFPVVDVTGL